MILSPQHHHTSFPRQRCGRRPSLDCLPSQRPAPAGVTDALALQLVCDLHALHAKVDLYRSLGTSLAQRWFAAASSSAWSSPSSATALLLRDPAMARLAAELESVVLDLVDVSAEIECMRVRCAVARHFFGGLASGRRRSWCSAATLCDDGTTAQNAPSAVSASTMLMRLTNLDECEAAVEALSVLLLGLLTAGEREEEEQALALSRARRSQVGRRYSCSSGASGDMRR